MLIGIRKSDDRLYEIQSFTALSEGNGTGPQLISDIRMDAHTQGLDALAFTIFVDIRTTQILLDAPIQAQILLRRPQHRFPIQTPKYPPRPSIVLPDMPGQRHPPNPTGRPETVYASILCKMHSHVERIAAQMPALQTGIWWLVLRHTGTRKL